MIDHVMTNWDYVKVEHVKTWLLSSSFANFQWFSSWFSFFSSFFYFKPYCLRGPWSIDTCRVLCFPLGFFWKVKNIVSVLFTVWNLQTGFPLKPMFSEGPSFFVLFVCNERELKMRLKVEALPTSVTVSWLVKTT